MIDLARTPRQIGSIIRNVRKAKVLNQTQLASRAGVHQETISMIENGNPSSVQTLLAVLSALDLELRIVERSKGDW
jgi:HTH-type transcriptional regulator/antitoxin HipB